MMSTQLYSPVDSASLAAVLDGWKQQCPQMAVLVLLPEAEKGRVEAIQQLCTERGIVLMGAIFPALVVQNQFVTQGAWLMRFDQAPTFMLADNLKGVGFNRLSEWVGAVTSNGQTPHQVFFIIDSMVPNIATMLNVLHHSCHHKPQYLGVNAGSETFTPMPCLFDNSRCVGDALLAVCLDATPSSVRHAYPVSKSVMRASAAEGNRIVEIDGRPAFDVYSEVIAREYQVQLTRDNFYQYAVHYPFGVVTALDVHVRIPVGLGDDLSIVCVGEIGKGAYLRLLKAPANLDASDCVSEIVEDLQLESTAQGAGRSLLTFYCAGRRMHFGEQAEHELERLRRQTGVAQLGGALSLGEIGTEEDVHTPNFHNAALVCLLPQ